MPEHEFFGQLDADDVGSDVLAYARMPVGTTGTTVAQGNHAHAGVYQPAHARLTEVAGVTPSANQFLGGTGSALAMRTAAQVKTSLAMSSADISDFVSALLSAVNDLNNVGGETGVLLSAAGTNFTRNTSSGSGGLVATNLSVALPTTGTCIWRAYIPYFASGDTTDLCASWRGPTGATGSWAMMGPDTPLSGGSAGFNDAASKGTYTSADFMNLGAVGTGTAARAEGTIFTSGTAGSLTLFAGRLSATGTITIESESYLWVKRIA